MDVLIGALGVLVSSIILAFVTHFLSLRYDRVRRDRDKQDKVDEDEMARKKEILNFAIRNPDVYREIREKITEEAAKKLKEQEQP